ncbi:MAG: hypothetical protein IMF11_11865 [Proteobacteria bacterium]|nr:hypothetical protein [Pseudomonadota bacterium]
MDGSQHMAADHARRDRQRDAYLGNLGEVVTTVGL